MKLDSKGVRRLAPALVMAAALVSAAGVRTARTQGERPAYLDPSRPLEARVEDLLSRMTVEEKVALVHADNRFSTAAVPRLQIPRRQLSDGPHGVREETVGRDVSQAVGRTDDFATFMPALVGLAATWNTELAEAYGSALGEEARQRGKQIMLAPGMNMMRTPLNGRNFEYLGEDPFLVSRMAVPYIRGEQSQGVASCAKHFVANDQEFERDTINVEMDERALREIYLPPFKAAVEEAGVLTVMSAYNKFRGTYCSESDYLLNKILKGEWGFKGLVVSDWNAVHSTRGSAMNGLDLEMGTVGKPFEEFYLARPFLEGVRKGEFPASVLDDKARRNLRVMFATHAFDGHTTPGSINTKEHQAVARRVAEESFVLLKNDGEALPLNPEKLTSVAVIGENAVRLQAYGGGSARIKAFYEVAPLEGILRRVGERVNVTYSVGYGEKAGAAAAERAVRAASQADVVIYVGGLNHTLGLDSEAADRKDLKLPYNQDELLNRIVEANPRTIVVLLGGGPVEMGSWLARAHAVLYAWYPGMEGGHALARVLFGDASPSGKLPFTFPARLEDSPAHALGAYPGREGTVRYDEGLLVGYRWFDTKRIAPLFPFGHGLSYTRFEYSNLKLVEGGDAKAPTLAVTFDLTNTGDREAAEVAQVYVSDLKSTLPRPLKELKGFAKVFLKPGERKTVNVTLDRNAFAFYDPERRGWVAERGDFRVMVGASSRDVKLEGGFTLAQTSVEK